MSEEPRVSCREIAPHKPHFYISAIAGGEPGPLPRLTCDCPGVSM